MFKKRGKKATSEIKFREKDHDSSDEEEDKTIIQPKTKNQQNRAMKISSKAAMSKSNTLSFEDDVYLYNQIIQITPVTNIKKVEKHDTYVEYIRKGTFSDKKTTYNSQRSSSGEYSEEKLKELASQQNKGIIAQPKPPIEVMEIESDSEEENEKVFTVENKRDIELTEEEAEVIIV